MYNLELEKNEEIIVIEDDIIVSNKDKSKISTVALTNKRLLFLDLPLNTTDESIRLANASDYIKIKEVYYSVNLNQIKSVIKDYIILDNNQEIIIASKNIIKRLQILSK